MTNKAKVILAILSFAGCANAASIVTGIGLQPGMRLQDSAGVFITTSVQYAVGSISGTVPSADATIEQIRSVFREFGRTTANADAAGTRVTNGTAISAVAGAVGTTVADFNTKQIYVLVGNTPNLDDATQYALYTGTTASGTNWLFPADVTGASSVNAVAANAGAINTIVGTETDNATGADFLRLAGGTNIPEPSSLALVALSLLGITRRRR